MPTIDCLTTDPRVSGNLFKLQNTSNGCGMITAFNLEEEGKAVAGSVSPNEVDGLVGEEFAVYEHFSKEFRVMKADECFELQLDNHGEYKLYVIVSLKGSCGMIGRIDKFISPATFEYNRSGEAEFLEDGPYAYVKDYELVLKEA